MTTEAGERAIAFLLAGRRQDGLWSDFLTLAGESTFWVTGYVGRLLLECGVPRKVLRPTCAELLARQDLSGGWGYNAEVPPDADSTAYVVLLLVAAGCRGRALARAGEFLAAHQDAGGGVATYKDPMAVAAYMSLPPTVSLAGWAQPEVAVTAAAGRAFLALGARSRARALTAWRFLDRRRDPDGLWTSYWWHPRQYPTAQAVLLARGLGERGATGSTLRRACAAVTARQDAQGGSAPAPGAPASAFAVGLALRAVAGTPEAAPIVRRAVNWLRAHQRPDGSWASDCSLRIPAPAVVDPRSVPGWRRGGRGTGALVEDHRRLYTTATCAEALAVAARAQSA